MNSSGRAVNRAKQGPFHRHIGTFPIHNTYVKREEAEEEEEKKKLDNG